MLLFKYRVCIGYVQHIVLRVYIKDMLDYCMCYVLYHNMGVLHVVYKLLLLLCFVLTMLFFVVFCVWLLCYVMF